MNTTPRLEQEVGAGDGNPFRRRLHTKLKGLYKPPAIDDACEREFHRQEPGVSMARDSRLCDFSTTNPF